jgi:hypothetical protein
LLVVGGNVLILMGIAKGNSKRAICDSFGRLGRRKWGDRLVKLMMLLGKKEEWLEGNVIFGLELLD